MYENKSVLITGGTGSFGKAFVSNALKKYKNIKRLVVFSRDELKQHEMQQLFSEADYPCLRYFIGDIRDLKRLERAFEGIDIVVHAAALKQVPAAEYNPFEYIQTNVIGSQNVIDASLNTGVSTVVALSTDKAAAPINLYGATKLCSDKLFIAANNIRGNRNIKFNVVRYGNVFGSRGSVIPFFLDKRKEGFLPITDKSMTRFNISLADGVKMVEWASSNGTGGEIFVPKIPSYRIGDLAEAVAPECDIRVVGIRPGEKIHEELITIQDSKYTVDFGNYYAILPAKNDSDLEEYYARNRCQPVTPGFSYNSGTNPHFLSVDEIRDLVSKYVMNA